MANEQIAKVRPYITSSYGKHMTEFLKRQFPTVSEKEIQQFIEDLCTKQMNMLVNNLQQLYDSGIEYDLDEHREGKDKLWPTLQILKYNDPETDRHKYGCMTIDRQAELLDTVNHFLNKIIAPFGSFYETPDKIESFLKGMIDIRMKQRKIEKKAMLKAKKNGDKAAEVFHNNNQATIKITMNSLVGAMGSGFNYMSSISNFNSVTSISRFFVMNAYAHAERLLEGNFYFKNDEEVIDFILNTEFKRPRGFLDIIKSFNLFIPSSLDVYNFLIKNLERYCFSKDHSEIKQLLISADQEDLIFIFYLSNIHNLFHFNENIFRTWIDEFITLSDLEMEGTEDPEDLYQVDSDLLVVCTTVCKKFMPINKKGNSLSAYDCILEYPDIAKRLVRIAKAMQKKIDEIWPIIKLFTDHEVSIGNVIDHKHMFRDTVISSDTDSIIFTTKNWVKWYTSNYIISEKGFDINAIMVYFLSKATAYVLYHISESIGTVFKDNLKKMNMKNEFMLSVDILTSLKKHYMSLLNIQEGVFFGEPRLDIKGVGLRGSNFVRSVLNYAEWMIRGILNDISQNGSVSINDQIIKVLNFERMIYDSLHEGNTEFLNIEPVKLAEEYKDSEKSIFFNYQFWEEVFAEKYGSIQIPTKCYMLPLNNLRSYDYEKFLIDSYPDIHRKLHLFLTKNPSKDINRIPINPSTDKVPEELRPIANYRAIVYSNTRPLYLILNSFGVSMGNNKKQTYMFSDIYGWVDKESGQSAREHI